MATTRDLGTVRALDDGRFEVRFERRFAHPPQRVWRAIAEPAELKVWFPAVVDFGVEPGAALRFDPTPEQIERLDLPQGQATFGELVANDPPRLLEYLWENEVLRWELSATDDGTLLVFTHIVTDRGTATSVGAGWHAGFELISALLDGKPVDWSGWDRAEELTPVYQQAWA